MANRDENLQKINEELEKLSDEELEQVVGGFLTAYVFLYAYEGDQVTYYKHPIGIPIGMNLFSWLVANNEFARECEKVTSSYSDFRKVCQSFADSNASQWGSPSTWGNVVMSAGVRNLDNMTSLADEIPRFENFSA